MSFAKLNEVLIIGINSQIGGALKKYLVSKSISVIGTTRKEWEVNEDTLFFDLKAPNYKVFNKSYDVVVVCASNTSIKECEEFQLENKNINVINTIEMIENLASKGSFIIYLSSDAVFSGKVQFCRHDEPTDPKNMYGRFKCDVENHLLSKWKFNSSILRLTKVVGENTPFIEQWKEQNKSNENIKTLSRKLLSPIHIDSVIITIYLIIKSKKIGIFQLGDREEISYTEYAKRYFKNDSRAMDLISEIDSTQCSEVVYNSLETHMPISCLACNSKNISILTMKIEHCVTSDCQPIDFSPLIFICQSCNLVQKYLDSVYLTTIDNIYKNYDIYSNANGEEQLVFFKGGDSAPRSRKIIDFVANKISLKSGLLLEIGCGNGSFLRQFSKSYPGWHLNGVEFDDKNKEEIEQIKNTSFYAIDFTKIDKRFDLIVCIHILEHMNDPRQFLINCGKMLNENGKIIIQVPDFDRSQYDIYIADHCSHFSIQSLIYLALGCNFKVLEISSSVVHKEITLLIENNINNDYSKLALLRLESFENLVSRVNSINLSKDQSLGIFGSSIAATVLFSCLSHRVNFFVDEDKNRIGNYHCGRPIFSINEIPLGSVIICPTTDEVMMSTMQRLSSDNYQFIY